MNLTLSLFLGLSASRIPIAVVVDSAKPYRYVSALTGKPMPAEAGSISRAVNYPRTLYMGDSIYFNDEIYIWMLRKDQNFLVKPLFNVPMEPGVAPTNDYAAVSTYTGPRATPEGLKQYGDKGGGTVGLRVPSDGSTVRLQNFYFRDIAAKNKVVNVRIGTGKGTPGLAKFKVDSDGVVDSTLNRVKVIESFRRYYAQSHEAVEDALRSTGLEATIEVDSRRSIKIMLRDDSSSEMAKEFAWFTKQLPSKVDKSQKEVVLSWILRTAYLRNLIAGGRRESDLAKMGKFVWQTASSPPWLKAKFPGP